MTLHSIDRNPDPTLTRIVQGYMPVGFDGESPYLRDRILPSVTVGSRQGKILQAGSEHISIHNRTIVGRSAIPEISFTTSRVTGWDIESFGLSTTILVEDGADYNSSSWKQGMREAEVDFTERLKIAYLVSNEKILADLIQDSANYTAATPNTVTLSGTSQYNDAASTPIEDFKTARKTVKANIGLRPNTVIMSYEVWEDLRYHADLIALISNDADKSMGLSKSQLASAMGVKQVLISEAEFNNGDAGAAEDLQPIWGKNIIFTYINPNPNPKRFERSFGYSYKFAELGTERMYTNPLTKPINARELIISSWYHDVIHSFDSAYLIKDAVA